MFDRKPNEREWLSWFWVLAWTGAIFLTIPFVRLATSFVKENWGSVVFTYAIILVFVVLTGAILATLLKRRTLPPGRIVPILVVAAIYIYLTFGLKSGTPEEAVHYIEYGILGCLTFRAFTHRITDPTIYLAATLTGALIGMIDEAIQWLVPGRYFDLRDIWLNVTAVALVQLGIAAGIRPSIIAGWPGARSYRRLCYLGAIAVGLMGLFHLNTPSNIAAYSARIPTLGFLGNLDGVMIEFGHLYDDPETGRFRSRLSPPELRRTDEAQAEAAAGVIARYGSRETYRDFLRRFSSAKYPFLHEFRVHLYSRNVNAEWAAEADNPDERRLRYFIAHRENRILEKYFSATLNAAGLTWPDDLARIAGAITIPGFSYESLVSKHLITVYTPKQAAWMFSIGVISLLLLGRYLATRARG